ncbi:hypothetical protein BJF78_23740 [Pseudonocardia sp. CNS-139]|nr:hypothetical protein BJF78_23740 [Pseudonocardia sp. CNS-139]
MVPLLAACGGGGTPGGPQEPDRVTYLFGTAAPNLADAVWFAVGRRAGFFAEERIDARAAFNDGGAAALQALVGGAGDVAVSELVNVVSAASAGMPVQVYANMVHRYSWFIAVPPDSPITSPQQLAGKKVGIISAGSGSQPFATKVLKDAGVDGGVEFVTVGAGAGAAEALRNGTVDALANLDVIFKTLEATGLTVRYLPRSAEFDTMPGALFVRRADDGAERKEAIDRFTRAAWRSMLYALANPDRAVQMTYEVFPDLEAAAPANAVDVAKSWLAYLVPAGADYTTVTDWASVSPDGFASSYAFAQDSGLLQDRRPVTYESLVDTGSFAAVNDFDRAAVLERARNG